MLSACTIEMITPTAEPTQSPTPTQEIPLAALLPTIAVTPSSAPTTTPTETPDPFKPAEAGERIFYDPLDDAISGWELRKDDVSSASFSSGMLVLTVNAPFTSLVSELPRDVPKDAYVEATVQTLLCGEGYDTFGIVFRRGTEYSYRYAITCFGKLRLERFKGFDIDGWSNWSETLGLLQGAPAANRIGVLVQGNIIKFFVGGVEVLARNDPLSESGRVGIFIQTEKSKVLSVGFEDFAVYTIKES
jgi:hypothetical protein